MAVAVEDGNSKSQSTEEVFSTMILKDIGNNNLIILIPVPTVCKIVYLREGEHW